MSFDPYEYPIGCGAAYFLPKEATEAQLKIVQERAREAFWNAMDSYAPTQEPRSKIEAFFKSAEVYHSGGGHFHLTVPNIIHEGITYQIIFNGEDDGEPTMEFADDLPVIFSVSAYEKGGDGEYQGFFHGEFKNIQSIIDWEPSLHIGEGDLPVKLIFQKFGEQLQDSRNRANNF